MAREKFSFSPNEYTNREIYYKYDSKQIKQILLARGLTPKDLEKFGNCEFLDDACLELKIFEAAETLKQRGIHDFSSSLISMILFFNTWSPKTSVKNNHRILRRLLRMFGSEARHKSQKYSMTITPTQILREVTGNYYGNLYEAREYWRGFVPSNADFQKSVRLPIPLSNLEGFCLPEEAAFVLGVIYAGGYIIKRQTTKHPCSLRLVGDKKDSPFFQDYLTPIMQSVFNLSEIYQEEERKTRDGDSTYILPKIRIDSMAVASWLKYDLRFPAEKTRNEGKYFPKICLSEHSYIPFISGFVSLKGAKHKERGCIRFSTWDKNILSQLSEQLQRVGIRVSRIYGSSCPFIEVTKSNISTLFSKLSIKNKKLLE